jgi:hypothetical protein
MSDFLMRMASRAAGVSPTVAPRLPFRIAHSATRQQDSAPRPSNFESQFASNNTYSDTASPRVSSTSFEMDAFRRSEAESSVDRSPRETQQHLPLYDRRSEDTAASDVSTAARDQILPQPILVRSRMHVQPENESLDFTARTHTLPDSGKPLITNPSQISETGRERSESPDYQSRAQSMDENAIDNVAAIGRVAQSFMSEPAANLPARNTAGAANSRQRTPSPEPAPVEVKIGRVEVIMENPAPPMPTRPSPPHGFDDYAALRRYSPQAWNRWTRNR